MCYTTYVYIFHYTMVIYFESFIFFYFLIKIPYISVMFKCPCCCLGLNSVVSCIMTMKCLIIILKHREVDFPQKTEIDHCLFVWIK